MFYDNQLRISVPRIKFLTPGKSDRESGSKQRPDFDSILMRALDEALISTFGESGATAVKFYIDTTTIRDDPRLFDESLGKMFGNSNAGKELIEKQIKRILISSIEKVGAAFEVSRDETEEDSGKTFSEFLQSCRSHYRKNIMKSS